MLGGVLPARRDRAPQEINSVTPLKPPSCRFSLNPSDAHEQLYGPRLDLVLISDACLKGICARDRYLPIRPLSFAHGNILIRKHGRRPPRAPNRGPDMMSSREGGR